MEDKTQEQPQWLTIASVKDAMLITSERVYYENMLHEEMAEYMDQEHGPGNWIITPTDNLPEGFDPATYTIEAGQLVPASAEVVAARQQAETARKAAVVRVQRNERLTATDRFMIPDFPLTDAQRETYLQYRAYLRDLPESDGFPNLPVMSFEEFISEECPAGKGIANKD